MELLVVVPRQGCLSFRLVPLFWPVGDHSDGDKAMDNLDANFFPRTFLFNSFFFHINSSFKNTHKLDTFGTT